MALPPLRTQVGADTAGFTSGIGSAVASLGTFKGGLAATGAVLTGQLVGGLAAATRRFADFDEKMTESQAIMGDLTEGTMARMEQQALDVSRATLKSADEAAESYFFLASAGLDAEQSIAALPQVARFAQAGMFDMARATELATDAQSALGMTSENAQENLKGLTRTTDVLVAANQQANATVEQFSESLTNKLGARLRILNKTIEEGTAGLAALADQGIKGRRAGRGLSIVYRDLAREAIRSAEAFEAQGIQVFDAQGRMRNLADIVEDLEENFAGLSDRQRTARLQQLNLNRRAISFLNTLIGMSDEIESYQRNLESAGGATEEVATKQVQTLNRELDLLGDQFEAVKIQAGEMVAEEAELQSFFHTLRTGMQGAVDDGEGLEFTLAALGNLLFRGTDEFSLFLAAQSQAAKAADEAERFNRRLRETRQFLRDPTGVSGIGIPGRGLDREDIESAGGPTAEERERRRQRKITAKAEETLQDARTRRLERELGLVDRIVARRKEELRTLVREDAPMDRRLAKAKEILKLQREGLETAARFQPGVTTPAAARRRQEGLPAGEEVEGGGPVRVPDLAELDVSDPLGRTADALEKGLVPALDEVAGRAIQGQSALTALADALLTAFGKEFGGEGGILGLGAKLASSFAGGFQSGGRVPAGTFGIAGEGGPEPFFAPRGGRVMSNREARQAIKEGGGKREMNIHVSANIRALDAAEVDTVLRRGGKEAIVEAVLEATSQSKDVSRAIVAGGG